MVNRKEDLLVENNRYTKKGVSEGSERKTHVKF